jgi:hypothetical protein
VLTHLSKYGHPSIGFQREPATLGIAGSLWNLLYLLEISISIKQLLQLIARSTLHPDEPFITPIFLRWLIREYLRQDER